MTVQLPASPYKGLTPFADTAIDAMLFFGRERDVEIVCANVVASRLTVLYGPSGVGKSSLLSAAVARRLRELPEHPVVVVFSAWSERPAEALAQAVAAEAGVETADSLATTVARASEARGDVYLLLDQAEEYFLYHPARRRARAGARRRCSEGRRGSTSSSPCATMRWRSSTVSRRRSRASSTTTSASTASPARQAAPRSCSRSPAGASSAARRSRSSPS